MRTGERGFSYLLLLFVLALAGVAAAASSTQWRTRLQREREAELLWRGAQIREAIERYATAVPPAGRPGLPPSLDALLSDERFSPPRHWLRALYTDPFTGRADWLLLRGEQGGIEGLASRSAVALMRRAALPDSLEPVAATRPLARDWHFRARAPEAAADAGQR